MYRRAIEKQVTKYYDALAESYTVKYDNPLMDHLRHIELKILEKYLSKTSEKILDVVLAII